MGSGRINGTKQKNENIHIFMPVNATVCTIEAFYTHFHYVKQKGIAYLLLARTASRPNKILQSLTT